MARRRKLTEAERDDAQRLRAAWLQFKKSHAHATQEWMSLQCGWRTQGAFYQYVAGVIPLNLEAALKVCGVLEISVSQISPRLAALMPTATAESGAGYGDGSRRIPVFDARQALSFASSAARSAATTLGLDAPLATACGAQTFALIVGDRAMQPEFSEGDLVIIDPETPPQPGEIVAAQVDGEPQLMLRKYRVRKANARQRQSRIELIALNEDFASITIDNDLPGTVIGPVIEHRRRLRRS